MKIVSLNPIPPALGSGVFANVDKNNCVLVVPQSSLALYAAADQWRDFLNVKLEVPNIQNITYRLQLRVNGYYKNDGDGFVSQTPGDGMPFVTDMEMLAEYKGTRIGEYYWSDVIDMDVPNFAWWQTHVSRMARYPIKQDLFDMYMPQIHIDYDRFVPNFDDFHKYYGRYNDRITDYYMRYWGIMYEGDNLDLSIPLPMPADLIAERERIGTTWDLPYSKDYRQLFAMCPFMGEGRTKLDEHDVRIALSSKKGDNPLAYDISNGTPNRTYWFEQNTNMYGFNMMPSGTRMHGLSSWGNGLSAKKNYMAGTEWESMTTRLVIYHYDKVTGVLKDSTEMWTGPIGGFSQLFYTATYPTLDGQVVIHDRVDTGGTMDYTARPVRWSRKLTDEELGYKLFIKVNNIPTTSDEWSKLVEGDEIPLLKQVKQKIYSVSDFDIVKIDNAKAIAPDGYIELPNGYIRGFYVQYLINSQNTGKSIGDIITLASDVDDNALDLPKPKEDEQPKTRMMMVDNSNLQKSHESFISVYPNVVQDVLNIESSDEIDSFMIFNLTGGVVKSLRNVDNRVDVSDLATGTYIVKITTSKEVYTSKIIKK